MPELIAKTALAGQQPVVLLGTTLAELDLGTITSIAPFPGQDKAIAKALKPMGLTFPAANSFVVKSGVTLAWSGREQAFLIGSVCPDMAGSAAISDQSGGWAALSLTGPAATDALMRYVPMDLRLAAFPVGRSVRTPLYHMSMLLMRVAEDGFTVLVFRSMARTAWHELDVALQSLAARASL